MVNSKAQAWRAKGDDFLSLLFIPLSDGGDSRDDKRNFVHFFIPPKDGNEK